MLGLATSERLWSCNLVFRWMAGYNGSAETENVYECGEKILCWCRRLLPPTARPRSRSKSQFVASRRTAGESWASKQENYQLITNKELWCCTSKGVLGAAVKSISLLPTRGREGCWDGRQEQAHTSPTGICSTSAQAWCSVPLQFLLGDVQLEMAQFWTPPAALCWKGLQAVTSPQLSAYLLSLPLANRAAVTGLQLC